MADVADRFGGLDVVVAGAAVNGMAPVSKLDPGLHERIVDVNLNGTWRTFRAALPHVAGRRSYLLAVSSMGAFVHAPLQASYHATKAGVQALVDALRLELRGTPTRVGAVAPTFFETPMQVDVQDDPAGQVLWRGHRPRMWRLADVDDVVATTVRAIERRADLVTVPRRLKPVALTAGAARPFVDRLGFRTRDIRRAADLASPTGWNDPQAVERARAREPAEGAEPPARG
jgi:NAD(P)-dependent dehydrogenase (short-subunit alcohol dehydrogenase family)